MLDEYKILERANELYRAKRGHDIESEQARAILKALVEAINAKVQH